MTQWILYTFFFTLQFICCKLFLWNTACSLILALYHSACITYYYIFLNWMVICHFISSPELKWAFLTACCLSSICPSVHKIFTYSSSHPEPLGKLQPNLIGTKHRWVKGIQVWSNEGPYPFQGEIIMKYHRKNTLTKLKSSSPEPLGLTWQKSSICEGNSSLYIWRAMPFSYWRINSNCKNTLTKFKSSSPVFSQMSDVAHEPLVLKVLIFLVYLLIQIAIWTYMIYTCNVKVFTNKVNKCIYTS